MFKCFSPHRYNNFEITSDNFFLPNLNWNLKDKVGNINLTIFFYFYIKTK